ncbi:MAG: hypothetical protein JSS96_07830 [Bacteroidetes bacterium]|nr:hypothetical protein [Bacteroidota bacterium]
MKNIILSFTCLLAINAHAQSFQLGFASGIMANYPATTPNLSANQTSCARNANVLTGLFARYDIKKRWSVSITASMFNKNVYTSNIIAQDPSISKPTTYGIYVVENYAEDCTFYLLDFSLQYNLNSKAALRNTNFKGIKSYVGITYTAIQNKRYIHGTRYDVIMNYNISISQTYNVQYRAIGLSYYASYDVSKRLVLSLNINGRLNTENLTPVSNVEYKELDPDYYLSTALGIAYRFTK